MHRLSALITAASRLLFAFSAAALIALSVGLVVMGGTRVLSGSGPLDNRLLDAVGYLIIAIAVADVGKYLLEEEVIRAREMRHVSEARKSLTRFVGTIIIVVLLEAIVAIFRVARGDLTNLPYPAVLLLSGVALLLALGLFQRLSASAEMEVGPADDIEERQEESGGP